MTDKKLYYAATIMLVRDGVQGMEVLMLERSGKSESFGGAFVFPGGKVDLGDAHQEYADIYAGHNDEEASRILSVPQYGLAYWTGAIRECFEEAGILVAYDSDGKLLDFHDSETKARYAVHRKALNNGEKTLLDICREEKITLATQLLNYFSHWVTPVILPRRFDTRFFICKAPKAQEPLIDNHEAVSQCWIRPADALERSRKGSFSIFFPTIKHLQTLATYSCSDELMAASAQFKDIPRILPMRKILSGDKFKILMPDDEDYDTVECLKTHY